MAGFGVALSGLYFCGIYYSNADPTTRGRSVAMYEMCVGLGSCLGPLLLGMLAWENAASLRPYLGGGVVLLLACAAISVVWLKERAARVNS